MMKYFTLLICACITSSLFSQIDIGLHSLYPASGSEVKSGEIRQLSFRLKAHTEMVGATRLQVAYRIDGGTVQEPPAMTIPRMKEGELSVPFSVPFQVPEANDKTIEVEFYFTIDNDTNALNDTIVTEYVVNEKVQNDIGINFFLPKNNSNVEVGKSINFDVVINNVGSTPLTRGTPLLSFITVNEVFQGQPSTIAYDEPDLSPGDSAGISFQYEFAPSMVGNTVDLCFGLFWSELTDTSLNTIEGNYNDNETCVSVNLIRNSSIDELSEQAIEQLQFVGNELIVGMKSGIGINQIELYTIDGHRVYENNLHANRYNIGELKQGIYLVKITDSTGRIYAKRAMKI